MHAEHTGPTGVNGIAWTDQGGAKRIVGTPILLPQRVEGPSTLGREAEEREDDEIMRAVSEYRGGMGVGTLEGRWKGRMEEEEG